MRQQALSRSSVAFVVGLITVLHGRNRTIRIRSCEYCKLYSSVTISWSTFCALIEFLLFTIKLASIGGTVCHSVSNLVCKKKELQ